MTAVKQPQDHRSKQRIEARDEPVTFVFDGDEFTIKPSAATGLEFLAALEDEQIIAALRHLLGREQAARLIKGRTVEDLEGFFDALGAAVDMGNL